MICEACGKEFEPSSRMSAAQRRRTRFCSRKCSAKINPPPRPKRKPLADRFWQKVDRSGGVDACWLWTGSTDEHGYGLVRRDDQRLERAHRVVLRLAGFGIPAGMRALHHCDNPPCCNPAHIYVGTPKANALDREVRGRSNRRRGETHGNAKITDAIVRLIRSQHPWNRGTGRVLAAQFGISEFVVSQVHLRRTWKHVS